MNFRKNGSSYSKNYSYGNSYSFHDTGCTHWQMYTLFFFSSTSLSRFLSFSQFQFPDVICPAVEKTLSIGALEAGIIRRSQATGARDG